MNFFSKIPLQTCNQMLALKTSCIHPTTGKPYILSSVGGRDISIENLQVCPSPLLSPYPFSPLLSPFPPSPPLP